jgi:hypothetical protein
VCTTDSPADYPNDDSFAAAATARDNVHAAQDVVANDLHFMVGTLLDITNGLRRRIEALERPLER